jgi:DNA replication and repair protein RecF
MRRGNALAVPIKAEPDQLALPRFGDDRIWVETLRLSDFRNYRSASLKLEPGPVVLLGENGAGKTNLLEAVSLLGPGNGLRGRPYVELCRKDSEGGWAVAAGLWSRQSFVEIGTGYGAVAESEATGRNVRISGKDKKSGALADFVSLFWLIPAMDGLFTGSPSERRRFLDHLVLAIDPNMRGPFGRFERAMRQRNRLFELREGAPSFFDGIEEQMAEAATAIAAARAEAIARLAPLAGASQTKGEFPWATLSLHGIVEEALAEAPAVEVEEAYRRLLRNGRDKDAAAGRTLEGPHRSDLEVGHGPNAMPARDCSSGEQKALLLGLVLAKSELLKSLQDGRSPILLLDEVAAHLDARRREALFVEILRLKAQAWMTGTDRNLFDSVAENAQILAVNQGKIEA